MPPAARASSLATGITCCPTSTFHPTATKTMDAELRQKTVAMYDFITAYQNLLRGGQTPVERTVVMENAKQSTDGRNDAVWTFAMAGGGSEVLHCINLTGTDNRWRDEEQTKAEPQFLQRHPRSLLHRLRIRRIALRLAGRRKPCAAAAGLYNRSGRARALRGV